VIDFNDHSQAGACSGQSEITSALLSVALHNANKNVHWAAAESLGLVGNGHPEVIHALLSAVLHDTDEEASQSASVSLELVGSGHPEAISALLIAIRKADEDMLWRATETLGRLKINDVTQMRLALVTLNRHLYSLDWYERDPAL